MKKNNEETIKVKLDYFFENDVKVHVSRKDGVFWNGYLTSKENNNVYRFEDDKLGRLLLFSIDIFDIQECRKVEG